MIRTLGRVSERSDRARAILARQDSVLAWIRERVRGLPPVTVVFTLGGTPPFVAGPSTFVGELIELAGGKNVFSDLERPWAGVSPETIAHRAPHVIVASESTILDPRVVGSAVVRRVPEVIQLPGPRLSEAALGIARAIRPDLFSP
jgi:iron complex transport system substrate-binding protein